MKNPARTFSTLRLLSALALTASLATPLVSQAASITLATSPLATSTTSSVEPNVMFVLDDSGSMAWDHMPDDASNGGTISFGYYGTRSSQCNMIYYDPNTTYLPPVDATGAAYADASFTAAYKDGFKTSSGTTNLDTSFKASADLIPDTVGQSAYYYSYSGTVTGAQKDYNSNTNAFYKECHDSTGVTISSTGGWNSTYYTDSIGPVNAVKALTGGTPSPAGSGVFTKHRYSPNETTTITVSGSNSTSVSSIKVNGIELMSATSPASTSSSSVAQNIAAQITLNGFSATYSGSTVTITGPLSAANYVPVITQSGTMTLTPDVFPDTTAANLTNFANWYSYYRTRLLMMKTSAGRAFKTLDKHYRVGFSDIRVYKGSPQVYVDNFWDDPSLAAGTGQRSAWYSALYNTTASSGTPLRIALSNAGKYYAGNVSGHDPIQYSCQQNFTILSTDGFWNGNTPTQLNGNNIGNQDGSADRPMYDGSNQTKTTTQVSQRQDQWYRQTSTLIGTLSKVLMRCNSTTATCGTAPSNGVANANWSVVTSGSCTDGTSVQCAKVSVSPTSTSPVAQLCNTGASITSNSYGTAVITLSNSNYKPKIKVYGSGTSTSTQLTSGQAAGNTNNEATIASDIASLINDCKIYVTRYCDFAGNSATSNGNTVTVTGPNVTSSLDLSVSSGSITYSISFTPLGAIYTLKNADSNGKIYSSCAYTAYTAPVLGLPCTTTAQSQTPNNTSTTSATLCTKQAVQAATLVASCTAANSGAPDYIDTTCTPSSTTVNNVSNCTPQVASSSNNYTSITCTGGTTGGTSDTLADVAMYYYQTDLRTSALSNCTGAMGSGVDVCPNNVFKTDTDSNTAQHMDTFTLGLGASGLMRFSPSYLTDNPGDYYSVWKGLTADSSASPPVCDWQADGSTCNWPDPKGGGDLRAIDDLWHAAVDGHGTYFSATDPTSLASGLSSALASIKSRKGASAAAATSTLNPVAGNNYAYVASYTTVKWQGNLEARTINVNTGVISDTASWCVESIPTGICAAPATIAADTSGSSTAYYCVTSGSTSSTCTSPGVFDTATSECRVPMATSCTGTMPGMVGPTSDTRTIYTANSSGSALIPFDAAYASANPGNFDAAHISTLSQWSDLISKGIQGNAVGANLVNYLRGQTGYEDRPSNVSSSFDNRLYRYREATLGDALESQPIYIGKPVFNYSDPGYSAFATTWASRPGTVYMGANDGMLHAFSALAEGSVAGGTERWAYVPSMVIPNMWKLADKNYATQHANFVNGSPIVSDVCTANCTNSTTAVWRTILVGGLNAGGQGYYALDVTDPTAPTLLWEFTTANDPDLGYSYGNPVITAKADGTWVVLLTSGYNNNIVSGSTGQGFLYVLNAGTGAIISKIGTGAGDTTTPSGLSQISAWSDASATNRATWVYGGDLFGNIWRFDINDPATVSIGTGTGNVFDLAVLKDPSGVPQPVTTSPVLGQISGKRIIFVGTGKYLETTDLTNTQVQTEYAIKDDNATVTLADPAGSPRNSTTLVQQTITNNGNGNRSVSNNPVDFSTGNGWYVDFPDSGERSNIQSRLIQGTLLVATIVPSNTVCSPGGYGWLNFFNYLSGGPIDSTGIVSTSYNTSIVGLNVLYINGAPVVEAVTSDNPTPTVNTDVLIKAPPTGFTGKRLLWRELNP